MRNRSVFICVCLCLILSLSACTYKSDKKISEEKISAMEEEYAQYLKETYPDETFTVEIWQEYGKKTGAAGLPDHEGYMLRQVCTDSKGNRFKVYSKTKGEHSDDYEMVLEGRIHYNEKGQQVFYDENGEIESVVEW